MVAYATEVDKRRKSSDSNSPKRSNKQMDYPNNQEDSPVFANDNKMSTLSMKFKGAARYQRQPSSPAPQSATPTGSVGSRAATPQSGGGNNSREPTPSNVNVSQVNQSRPQNSKSPLPGENLPEHHPKKRYFAETRDSCSSSSGGGGAYRRNSMGGAAAGTTPPPPSRSSGLPNAMSSFYPESREITASGLDQEPTLQTATSSTFSGVISNKNRPTMR